MLRVTARLRAAADPLLPFWLEMERVPRDDWAEVTQGVQVMWNEMQRAAREQQG